MTLRTLFITIFFITPLSLYAQSNVSIVVNPNNPAPYEKVTLTLQSYSFDVNLSTITWIVSGKQISSGVGNKNITITTQGVGQDVPVIARITSSQKEVIETKITITPESVDLIWETPESYVPPFYEGRSLPSDGALIRITAIPNMSEGKGQIPAQNLSYLWYINGILVDESSGYGKNTASLNLDYFNNKTEVKVLVKSALGREATKTITITPHEVMPILYEYNDTLGTLRNTVIENRLETTRDFTLSLAPYYLSSVHGLESAPLYTWLLDGFPITPEENTLLTFHPKENSFGTKTLSIVISNTKRRLQKAETALEILFDTRN